ncbi:MAG: lysophospholipid acyltransferase family protein [Kordiimonas sp.]
MRAGVNFYCASCIWLARWVMGIKLEHRGLEHCPKEGGFILAAAHQSNMDPMIAYCVRSDVSALAKKELFSTPFVGPILKKMQIVRIDRQAKDAHKGMSNVAKHIVEMDRPLIVYPQATRVLIGQTKKLKSGAYFVHQDTKLPVVPVATNTGLFWSKGFWHRSGTAVFEFGEPLPADLSKDAFMKQLKAHVVDRSDELVTEAGYGHLLPAHDSKKV